MKFLLCWKTYHVGKQKNKKKHQPAIGVQSLKTDTCFVICGGRKLFQNISSSWKLELDKQMFDTTYIDNIAMDILQTFLIDCHNMLC